jgi:hypothetical protein|tara:strand:+ start:873 stop:1424 length:552 start_codon:yes stop_codon:yes gene_type:complete
MFALMSLKDIAHGYETPTSLKNECRKYSFLFENLVNLKVGDKIGKDTIKNDDGKDMVKYTIYESWIFQKLVRFYYREDRNNTINYLDEDFNDYTNYLDRILQNYKNDKHRAYDSFVNKNTEFINKLIPGLYNLKKTYPDSTEITTKIDSIILTLFDFKSKVLEIRDSKKKNIATMTKFASLCI